MVLAGGWARDRFGSIKTIRIILLVSGCLTVMLGMVKGPMLIVMLFIQPLVGVCFFPAGFALLSSIDTPRTRNVVISLTMPISTFLASGAIPA